MNNEELKKLIQQFQSPVKDIRKEGENTVIEFDDGEIIPLVGGGVEIEVPKCNFCGKNATDTPLFTNDDKSYICPDCTTFALKIFLKRGINIEFEVGDIFPEALEQLKKILNK